MQRPRRPRLAPSTRTADSLRAGSTAGPRQSAYATPFVADPAQRSPGRRHHRLRRRGRRRRGRQGAARQRRSSTPSRTASWAATSCGSAMFPAVDPDDVERADRLHRPRRRTPCPGRAAQRRSRARGDDEHRDGGQQQAHSQRDPSRRRWTRAAMRPPAPRPPTAPRSGSAPLAATADAVHASRGSGTRSSRSSRSEAISSAVPSAAQVTASPCGWLGSRDPHRRGARTTSPTADRCRRTPRCSPGPRCGTRRADTAPSVMSPPTSASRRAGDAVLLRAQPRQRQQRAAEQPLAHHPQPRPARVGQQRLGVVRTGRGR